LKSLFLSPALFRQTMKKPRSPVILSAAKNLRPGHTTHSTREILRCAQDDRWGQVCNGMHAIIALMRSLQRNNARLFLLYLQGNPAHTPHIPCGERPIRPPEFAALAQLFRGRSCFQLVGFAHTL